MLMQSARSLDDLEDPREFMARHIGIDAHDESLMLKAVGAASRRELIDGITSP